MRITDQLADLRLVARELPLITDSTVKVLRPFDQGMPKNLFGYCETIDERFVNNNLALIDEIKYRDPLNSIPKWFREYQKYNFGHTDILNHDLFFKTDSLTKKQVEEWIRQHPGKSMISGGGGGARRGYFVNFGKLLGTTVETDGNTALSGNNSADFIEVGKCTTFTANAYYDQILFNIGAAAGNLRVCLYDDNANSPNNLVGSESGSVTPSADYTTIYSIGEGQMPATDGWMAHNQSSAGLTWGYWNNGGTRNYKALAFGAMPNPLTGTSQQTGAGIPIPRMKAQHS